jgi:DNA-directed RNA polymerase subunit RPC12/RpoP
MIYLKTEISEGITITVPVYDDEFYAKCPDCGKEHNLDPETVAGIIKNSDTAGTSVCCEECSAKRAEQRKK